MDWVTSLATTSLVTVAEKKQAVLVGHSLARRNAFFENMSLPRRRGIAGECRMKKHEAAGPGEGSGRRTAPPG